MSKSNTYQPTEAELDILQILWEHQPVTIKFIHEQLLEHKEVSYTTVLTQVQRMYNNKKILERTKQGKTHLYRAIPVETDIQQSLVNRLVNTAFKGSPMKLVLHALGESKTNRTELEELEQWLQEQKKHNSLD